MENAEFKDYAKKLVPSSFDEIEKKIKEYNESKNKKEAPTPYDEIKDEEEKKTLEDINDIIDDKDQ